MINGREVVIFSSNDYLGLSANPGILRAANEAGKLFGAGTGAAPKTTGTTLIHEKLEEAIAKFKSRQKAVLFPSGYQANQAIHHSLDDRAVVFFVHKRHHPSALDGVRLARKSRFVRFDHDYLDDLRRMLIAHGSTVNIVTLPSVFTIDGDIAPLERIAALKQELGFVLILDEAHADGCVGKTGKGLEEHFGHVGVADFLMGTFSKAFGSQGGYLAFNETSRRYLKSPFRAHEYSTSLSAVSVAAALAAVEILENENSIMESLRRNKKLIIKECAARGISLIARESMIMLLPCHDCSLPDYRGQNRD
jgi:7-keto-8-aminopelargonate synthetase-like enzyme